MPKSFAQAVIETSAERALAEPTIKGRIIGERGTAVGVCAVAMENHKPIIAGRELYIEVIDTYGIQPTGAVDVDAWNDTMRTIGANLKCSDSEMNHVLATVSMKGNPYYDLAKFSHPSMGGAKKPQKD